MKFAATLLAAALPLWAGADDSFLIRGVTVHPVSGPEVPNTSLLVRDGKIAEIGSKAAASKGVKAIDGKGLHVYPGMIDSGTDVGMAEVGAVRETHDTTELGEFKPQLRAGIAVNPSSEHIAVTRANGITSFIALPEGGTIAGQASLMHTDGWTWEEMQVRMGAGMHLIFPSLGPSGGRGGGGFGGFGPRVPFVEARRTYDRRLRELNEYLESARRYQKAKAAGGPGFKTDLHLEAMLPVLERKMPLVVTAMRDRAIKDAVAFADKEKVRIVLAGVRKPGETVAELKKRDIPVILGPTLALPLEEDDPYDEPFALAGELYKAGVKIAFASFSSEFSRNLPYQAANAVGFGLPEQEALKAVTLNPAQIWGVADEIGSIEVGKWADLMVTDGDPLQGSTNVKHVFIKGKEVDLESKHTKLYKKYLARP
jgi:imidazolonepropionase-like amidohydrolase